MDQLLKGGPKQQHIDGTINNMNPFKNMVDHMTMNDSQMREKLENYQGAKNYNDFMMENSFNNTNQINQNQMINQNQLNNQLEYKQNLQYNNNNQLTNDFNQNFDNLNINTNIQSTNMNNQNYYPQNNYGYGGGSNMMHPMLQRFNLTQVENNTKDNKTEEKLDDDELKEVTKDIIQTMNDNANDERFENSEFLKFIKKLHTKEILLEEKSNSIIQNQDYKPNNEMLAGTSKNNNFIKEEEEVDKIFNKVFNEVKENFNNDEDVYQYMQQQEAKASIFEENNPYLVGKENENIDLVDLAKKLLSEGKSQEAKLVLEAESQKNGDNTEAWTMLGRIHSENDCDNLAFQCLLRALDVDPFNLDAELALGILCTNEFDELDAMVHLKNWIKLHPIYSKYLDENNPILDESIIKNAERMDIDGEDVYQRAIRIEKMKTNFYIEMTNLMESIFKNNGNDSDLLISMGICHFIPSNNERSIQCFRKAVEVNPKDHNAWNKLGAVFAHSKHHDEAINCYKKALELKPDYVRCWANFGIANYNIDNYVESSKCYLKALSICPGISHVWSYLRAVLIASGNQNYLKLVEERNLNELCKIFKI